jgi:hypothetical protein
MRDNLIGNFQDLIQKSKIKTIKLSANNSEVIVTKKLFTYRIFIDLSIMSLAVYGTYNVDDKNLYQIPIIIVWMILFGVLWMDFDRINKIIINTFSKNIQIISRNIFKRIFLKYILNKNERYSFEDVISFTVDSIYSSKADIETYLVYMNLKGKSTKLLTSFSKEEIAHIFSSFLMNLIKN